MRPDYTFIETPSFVWFQFPWSRLSDYMQFAVVVIEESIGKGKVFDLDSVAELFFVWYGFRPDYEYLRKALERLVENGFLKEVSDSKFTFAGNYTK